MTYMQMLIAYLPFLLLDVSLLVLGVYLFRRGGKYLTWAPFQPDQVQEICSHMTPAERKRMTTVAGNYGGVMGLSIAGLFAYVILGGPLAFFPTILIVWGLFLWWAKTWIRRWNKRFLASTEWATQQGISSDDIKLQSL